MTLSNWIMIFAFFAGGNNAPKIDRDFAGTYIMATSGSPRSYQKKIMIDCDSTVSTFFRGDLFNDKLSGRWTKSGDTLTIKLEPSFIENGKEIFPHWNKKQEFLIKKNKLIPIFTEAQNQLNKTLDKKLVKKLNKQMLESAFKRTEIETCN